MAAQGMTQKEIKEAQEARAAKRQTTINWIVGIVITALVVALLVWGSGFFQKRATAAVIGDTKLPASEMQYYHGLVRSELDNQYQYAQYGIEYPMPENTKAYDFNSAEGDSQVYNTVTGQTYAEHFREEALKAAKENVVLAQTAQAEGFTVSAESKAALEENLKNMKSQVKTNGWSSLSVYLKQVYGDYVDEGVYKTCMERGLLAGEYAASKQDALTYTTQQMTAYQTEHPAELISYDFRYAYISGDPEKKVDEDGKAITPTDEEKADAAKAAKEKADALVKGVQAADDKESAFNTLVKDAVAEGSSYADPAQNLQSKVMGADLSGTSYFDWLSDSARKSGEITAIENGTGFYVVLFLKAESDETPTADIRHILINADPATDDPATEDVDESEGMPTQAAMDAAKAKAQAILDEFNALSEDKRTSEAFGDLAKKHSADTASAAEGGRMRYVSLPNNYVPSFSDWVFDSARKSGDTDLVENFVEGNTYAGYHVMYYVGQDGPKWQQLADQALRKDDMTKWLEEVQAPVDAQWADNGSIGK